MANRIMTPIAIDETSEFGMMVSLIGFAAILTTLTIVYSAQNPTDVSAPYFGAFAIVCVLAMAVMSFFSAKGAAARGNERLRRQGLIK